jgi:NitT/TauT family transport system substrate-binding protein
LASGSTVPASSAQATSAAKPEASAKPAASSSSAASAAASAAAAKPSSTVTLTVGVTGSLADLPVYVGIERGYFKEQGVDTQIVPFGTSVDEIPQLASGQLLVGGGSINAGLFNAIARGIPMKIVADQGHDPAEFQGTGWTIRKELLDTGQVKDPKDLKGRTVAGSPPGTTTDPELDILLKRGGLTLNDIKIQMVGFADLPAAYASKAIDLGVTFEPLTGIIQSQGTGKMWITSGQLLADHEVSVRLFSPVLTDKYPVELARNWMLAYVQAVRDVTKAYAQPPLSDDIVNVITKYTSQKDPAAARRVKMAPINPDGFVYRETLQYDLDYFASHNLVNTPPALDKTIDNSFVDYAISKLGRYNGPKYNGS